MSGVGVPDEQGGIASMLAKHRVNYHHRNVGPKPVTAENLRYTSCEGCDWLGGHHDEEGWEQHLAAILTARLAPPVGAVGEAGLAEKVAGLAKTFEARQRMLKDRKPTPNARRVSINALDGREANTWDVAADDLRALLATPDPVRGQTDDGGEGA